MAHALIWSARARAELFDILDYVSARSPLYANAISERFEARADLLPDQPRQGRRFPENRTGRDIREVFVHRWRLIYEVTADHVVILAVLHGARASDDLDL